MTIGERCRGLRILVTPVRRGEGPLTTPDHRVRDRWFLSGRASAPREDQDIGGLLAVEVTHGLNDFAGGAFALDANGIKHDVQIGEPALQNVDDVADGGALRRRN